MYNINIYFYNCINPKYIYIYLINIRMMVTLHKIHNNIHILKLITKENI